MRGPPPIPLLPTLTLSYPPFTPPPPQSPLIKAKVTLADLEKRVMGIKQLITEEELAILQYTDDPTGKTCKALPDKATKLPSAGPNAKMNTILVWLSMTFDKMIEEGVTCGHVSLARKTSLCINFQENLMGLRGAMATFVFINQFPIPLAYAHMLQMLVDFICFFCPFATL